MAIQLNFKADSIIASAPMYIHSISSVLAFESCSAMLIQLKEVLSVIESKLLKYCEYRMQFDIRVMIGDIWQAIHLSHRLHNLFPSLNWTPGPEAQDRFNIVSGLTRSFFELPNLINSYFSTSTDNISIMGDFIWSYRAEMGGPVYPFFCRGGNLLAGGERSVIVDFNRFENTSGLHRHDGYTGILTLDFLYIREVEGKIEQCTLKLDELVTWFNNIIEKSERLYGHLINIYEKSNPDSSTERGYFPPHTINLIR